MEWNEGSKKPSDLFLPHDEQGRVVPSSQTAAVQLGAGSRLRRQGGRVGLTGRVDEWTKRLRAL